MSLTEKIQEAQRFRAGWEALADILKAVDEAAGLEQFANECESRVRAAEAALATVNAKIAEEAARAGVIVANACAEADKIKADAKASAKSILDTAKSDAATVVELANGKAADLKSSALSEAKFLAEQAATAKRERDEAVSARDEVAAHLAELTDKLDRARDAARQMMGG